MQLELEKKSIDKMSPAELEAVLDKLKKEDKYPHLAALIAYALTYHYYYMARADRETNDARAKVFFKDTLELLERPPGYGWCLVSVPFLAGIIMPHYLHEETVKRAFSRLL